MQYDEEDDMQRASLHNAILHPFGLEREPKPKGKYTYCDACKANVEPVRMPGPDPEVKGFKVPCLACYVRSGLAGRDAELRQKRVKMAKLVQRRMAQQRAAEKQRRRKTGKQTPRFVCDLCGKRFTPKVDCSTICPNCRKGFEL